MGAHTDGMLKPGEFGRRFWRSFMTPPSPAALWKRSAWSLWLTPPTMLFPLLLPVLEPSSIPGMLASYWHLYLLFFGLPFALGAFCWRRGTRTRGTRTPNDHDGSIRTLAEPPQWVESGR
jgi:hypothetical protein